MGFIGFGLRSMRPSWARGTHVTLHLLLTRGGHVWDISHVLLIRTHRVCTTLADIPSFSPSLKGGGPQWNGIKYRDRTLLGKDSLVLVLVTSKNIVVGQFWGKMIKTFIISKMTFLNFLCQLGMGTNAITHPRLL